jgi:hypothetical protein
MAPLLALSSTYETFWIASLILGAVVLVVVTALLHWLLRIVQSIVLGVRGVWESATRLASNTATTWQLRETAVALDELTAEALRHDALLDSRL